MDINVQLVKAFQEVQVETPQWVEPPDLPSEGFL